jgi:glucokinase
MADINTTPPGRWAIGVDLGGSKIKVGGVSEAGTLFATRQVATPAGDAPAVIDRIVALVTELRAHYPEHPPAGVGVGVAGQVIAGSGMVHFAPNLRWDRVPLQEALTDRLSLPVRVLNDVRAATYGEWTFGAGRGCTNLVCLFLGTGIGGGIVTDGRLLVGHSNSAGELGHHTVDLNGPPCSCGNHGCLEALTGGWAIKRDGRRAATERPEAARALLERAEGKADAITARTVIDAYHAGDALATEIITTALTALEAGLVNIVNGLNPERILLGGGLATGLQAEFLGLEAAVKQRALSIATADLQLLPAALANDAGAIGAGAYILRGD